jgi:hypothetical protein
MVYKTQNYWVFGLFPSSGILVNTTFRKLDLSTCLLPHLHLRTETDSGSETSCFLEYQTMEKVQKLSNYVNQRNIWGDTQHLKDISTYGKIMLNVAKKI